MEKAIATDTLILMILIGLTLISIFIIASRASTNMGWNICVRDQFGEISRIEEIAKEMELGMEKATGFKVKWCTRCIWYEENSTHKWLKVWIKNEPNPETWFVENKYFSIGNSDGTSRLNKDNFEYSFWVRKGEVNCTNCFEVSEGCPK